MYAGFNGESCVCTHVCITGRSCTCLKMIILALECTEKGEMRSAEGNGRPSEKYAWSEANFSITIEDDDDDDDATYDLHS
jgi:hypothetical protein